MNTPEGWKHCDKCDTRVDCCLRGCAALAAASVTPASSHEGWKLVPVEPTQEMQSAAERYARHHNRVPFSAGYYRAMLAAAPTPPEQPGESVCATCGGLVSDPVIAQPAAQGELTFCQMCGEGVVPGLCRSNVGQCANAARKRPAAQGEVTDEQIDDCMPLGIAPYSTLVGRVEIRRFARAVIAADRAARKRPEAEVAEIMGAKRALVLAAIAAGVAKVGSTEDVQEQLNADLRSADANFERLVRGGGS